MKKEYKIFIAVLLLVMVLAAIFTFRISSTEKEKINEEAIAAFSNIPGEEPYTDISGNPVALDSYLGKYLVVTSWASWSPFSEADLKNFDELSAKFNSEEIIFLAINRKESKEQAARYLATLPELNNVTLVLDPRDNFYGVVQGYAMPEIVTYDKDGVIVDHFRGVVAKDALEEAVNKLMNN